MGAFGSCKNRNSTNGKWIEFGKSCKYRKRKTIKHCWELKLNRCNWKWKKRKRGIKVHPHPKLLVTFQLSNCQSNIYESTSEWINANETRAKKGVPFPVSHPLGSKKALFRSYCGLFTTKYFKYLVFSKKTNHFSVEIFDYGKNSKNYPQLN